MSRRFLRRCRFEIPAEAERVNVLFPELRHPNRDSFIEAFGIGIDAMKIPSESVKETLRREPAP